MMRSLIAIAALMACSGAWAEVIYLECETTNHDLVEKGQGRYNRVYVIDTTQKDASVHYDYGYMATGKAVVTAGTFQLHFLNSGSSLPMVEISRISGNYNTEFDGTADSGECQSVDNLNIKF